MIIYLKYLYFSDMKMNYVINIFVFPKYLLYFNNKYRNNKLNFNTIYII